jgi:hypothetical protein
VHTIEEAVAEIKDLGSPADLWAAAGRGVGASVRRKSNMHIHLPPNFSAFRSVQHAIDLARAEDVPVLGGSNYYDYNVYGDFAAAARAAGLFPLFGLEVIGWRDDLARQGVKVNDPGNPGKFYLCAKGLTRLAPMTKEASRILGLTRSNDADRMARMLGILVPHFARHGVATGLTLDAVKQGIVRRYGCPPETVGVQERHVAQALQESFFAQVPPERRPAVLAGILGAAPSARPDDPWGVQNDIRSHLMKAGKLAFVKEALISFDEGYRLIIELGGIPCYTALADGASPICEYEAPVEKLVEEILGSRFYCAELIPIRNEPDLLTHYVKTLRAAGLPVMGGTEHNTLNVLPMGPTCLRRLPLPEEVADIFWEGACVVAAHQFLTYHGECGFVDGEGRLNPAYPDAERRIAAFARLGAAVIDAGLTRWGRRQ